MQKSYPVDRYDFGDYDKHLCLRPPRLLLIAAIFLCRDFILPIIVAISSRGSRTSAGVDLTFILGDPGEPGRFFTAIPALLFIVGLARRSPGAPALVAFLWNQGRWLLAAAAAMQIYTASLGVSLVRGSLHYDSGFSLVVMGIDVLILGYVLLSRRVRDALSDFPEAVADSPIAAKRSLRP